jgi:hypothetical protein
MWLGLPLMRATRKGRLSLKKYLKITLLAILSLFSTSGLTYAAGITVPLNSQLKVNTGTFIVPGDVADSGTVVLTTGTIKLTGNWTNSGTLTAGTGTVEFLAGSGTQTLDSGGTGATKAFYHLKHSGAGTLELLTNAVKINGNFTNSAGTFDTKGLAMNVAGSWSNTATFTHSSGTVTFDATTGTPTINAVPANGAFYDLTFQAPGITYTLNSALAIDRDISITSGTLDAGSYDVTVARNWSVHNTNGGFISSGTVTFNGSSKQTVSTGGTNATHDFQNFTHSGSAELELDPNYNLTVNGTLTQSGAGDFDTQAKGITAGSLDISNGTFNTDARAGAWAVSGNVGVSTATLTATSASFNIAGSFSNSGTFNNNNGSITFNATSGSPTIDAPVASGAFNAVTFNDAGNNITFTLTSAIKLNNNLTITGGTLNANSQDISVGGNWDNNDIFTPGNSTVTFDASTTGETIEAGASSFYAIVLDNALGGWTIQTDNLTCTNDFNLTAATAFALSNGRTLQVQGQFANHVGGTATTWTSSTLYLNGSGSYAINNKTDNGDLYDGTLRIGASQAARMWKSSASTYTIDSGGSLYSIDHAGTDGELYIWGDYDVPEDTTDWWAYATDFDAASLTGSERQCKVFLADAATVSCASGETLRIIGVSGNPTLINRQGPSGTYGININNGFLRAQYYSIERINGNGLNISGASVTVTNLDYGSFDNSEGSGTEDAFITVAGESINNNPSLMISGVTFNNNGGLANFNVRATGSSTSFWDFEASLGSFDGEAFDSDPGPNEGNPGYLVWDNSAGAAINISGMAYEDDNEAVTVDGARVSLAVNDTYNSFATTSNGTFSFSGISVQTGDTLTFYFDGESFKGSTVTICGSSSINDMRIYKNHLVVRSETVGGSISINQMAKFDKDSDPDINFDAVDSGTDTLVIDDGSELFIPAGEEFQPLGNLQAGTDGVYDVDIRGAFTCAAFEIIRVSGSWKNAATATFAPAESTVIFDGSSGTPQIDSGGDNFYNLIINSSVAYALATSLVAENNLQVTSSTLNAGNYSVTVNGNLIVDGGTLNVLNSAVDVAGDVSISSGTLAAPGAGKSFSVAGNWANTGGGIFTSVTGKVTFDKASGTQTINAGGIGYDDKDFYNIDKTGAGVLQLINSGLEADGTLIVSTSTTFDLNGQDLNLGTLNNSGTLQMLGSEVTVAIATMDTAKGEVTYVGDGDETPEIFTLKNFGALDYYDLTINDTHTTKDIFRTAADLGVNAELQVLGGELDVSFNGNNLVTNAALTINGGTLTATNANIDANSDVTLTSGTLTAPTTGQYFRIMGSLALSSTFTNSSGEITFDATTGTPTISTGGNSLYDTVFNDAGNNITFTLNSDIIVNNLNITSGTLNTGTDQAITAGGNWSNAGSFVSNNSIVTFNKASGTQTINAGGTGNINKDFQTLTKTGGGTLQLVSSGLEVDGTLTVSSATTLDLNGQNLNAGTLDNSDTVELHGNETVNVTTNDTDSGTVRYVGDGDGTQDTFNLFGFGGSQYYYLTINDTNTTKDTFQTTQDVAVYGDLTVNGGTLTATSHNIDVNGSFNLASGTCNAPDSGKTLTVADDFTVAGTFNAGSGTVVFDDSAKETILDAPGGGLSFNNFSCTTTSKILNFTQSDTFSVGGVFTLNGSAVGTRIDLNSSGGAGTTWNLILTGSYSVSYVDVQGSKASGTVTFPIDPSGSNDSGNNTNWFPIASSDDSNMLRSGADRHTFYDGTYYWIFYIDTDSNVVYKKSTDGGQWGSANTVSTGDYKSLGIWEDGTYIWCCYADGSNSYERRITISNGALGTEKTLTSAAQYHSQPIKSASGYIHRKAEKAIGGQWKVYNYTGNIGATASANINITAVSNLNRAFILAPAGNMSVGRGAGGAQQNANEVLVRAKFNSTSEVQINRGAATGDSAYSFYVIEDASGNEIYVVSGSNAFTANADADLTITPTDVPELNNITDTSKCVVFLTTSSNSGAVTRYNQACVRGWVDSSKNVQLRRTAGNSIATVDWFVVEFKGSDWSVQQGDFSLTTGTEASPQTQTISSVNTANAFVFMNWEANTNGLDYTAAKVELYDSTTLRFSRQDVIINTCTCRWFVVSNPCLSVQRGSDAAATTDASEDQPITQVDTARAFPVTFNDCNGTATAYPRPYWRAWLSNSTTLYWDRSYTGQDCNFKWQVVEFPRGFYWMRSTNANDDSSWNTEEEIAEDTDGTGHCMLVPLTTTGSITAFANAGGGKVTVTSAGHGCYNGDSVKISETTNYNAAYTVSDVAANTFNITATWAGDDGTGRYAVSNLKIMALYNDYDTGTYNLRYKVYNGTIWGSEGTVVTDCQDTTVLSSWAKAHYFSAVSDDAGYVYVIYQDTSGNIKYTYYDGSSWSSASAVSDNTGCSHPSLFYDAHYETLYAFWLEGTDLKYKRFTGNWNATATTLRSNLVSPACLGVAYSDADSIGIVWQQGDPSAAYQTLGITPTIVNLADFYALGLDASTKVYWRTESEINNAGFNLYRSKKPDADYVQINAVLIGGLGTSTIGREYEYMDTPVTAGTYYYILESVELNGLSRKFGPVIAHPGRDTDDDGMSDDYEYFYGLDPAVNDATLDPDNDGSTNLQEYQNVTDPYSAPEDLLNWEAVQPGTPGITVISSNDSEIVLELVTNEFDTTTKVVGADTYHKVNLPDYAHAYTDEVGKPQVPLKSILLSMSGKKPLNVTVLDYDREQLSGYNIYPVPQRLLVTQGDVVFLATQFYKNNLVYSTNDYYPYKLAEIDYSSYLRGQEVVKVRFYPFQFNPVTGAVDFYNRLRIRLTTQEAPAAEGTSGGGSAIPLGVVNAVKFQVDQDGIYRVTYQNLVDAGVNASAINPKNFKLYYQGTQIPIYVYGESDSVFNTGDYIEFYGKKETSRYTYTNVYWLAFNEGLGLRMEEKSASAGITPSSFLYTHHFEQNTSYWMESEADDPWFFNPQIAAGATQEFITSLTDVVNAPKDCVFSASLRGNKWGETDVTHHLRIYLNNHIVGDVKWLNNEVYNATLAFPSYWLKEGNNTIKLASIVDTPADNNGRVLADWFDISYWRQFKAQSDYLEFTPSGVGNYNYTVSDFSDSDIRVYDVTEHSQVKRIPSLTIQQDGATFKASFNDGSEANSKYAIAATGALNSPAAIVADIASDLRSTSNQADYIIITCDNFSSEIAALALYRQQQGLTVKTVKLTDVYDEFNYGISSPYAIKYFLNYTYTQWKKPAPTYVLLVGDATYDFRDDEGYGFTDYMPTFLFFNQEFGETAWDDWFACFDSDTDIFPEMLVGRFPAKTPAEVTNMVNKTIAYENVSLSEFWTKRAILVADNAAVFESISDTLASMLTDKYFKTKLYLASYGNANDCKQDIIQDINLGALLVNYTGHGGIQSWSGDDIFTNNDIALLNNKDKYPFVLNLNCVNGYFIYPEFRECLAEELLRAGDKGAVAALAPSGMSLTTHQQILAEGIYDSLFKQQERILGSAVAKGKLYLFQEAADTAPETLKQFILFGDPALILRKEAVPVAQATAPSVYTPSRGISSLYSLNISTDASKIYPSILFEPELERSLPKEKPKVKKSVKPKEKLAGSGRSSLIDTLSKSAQAKQEQVKEEAKVTYSFENKIVRLGSVADRQEKLAETKPVAEVKQVKEIPLPEAAKTKPVGFWKKIALAITSMFKAWFGAK